MSGVSGVVRVGRKYFELTRLTLAFIRSVIFIQAGTAAESMHHDTQFTAAIARGVGDLAVHLFIFFVRHERDG